MKKSVRCWTCARARGGQGAVGYAGQSRCGPWVFNSMETAQQATASGQQAGQGETNEKIQRGWWWGPHAPAHSQRLVRQVQQCSSWVRWQAARGGAPAARKRSTRRRRGRCQSTRPGAWGRGPREGNTTTLTRWPSAGTSTALSCLIVAQSSSGQARGGGDLLGACPPRHLWALLGSGRKAAHRQSPGWRHGFLG